MELLTEIDRSFVTATVTAGGNDAPLVGTCEGHVAIILARYKLPTCGVDQRPARRSIHPTATNNGTYRQPIDRSCEVWYHSHGWIDGWETQEDEGADIDISTFSPALEAI